MTQRVKSSPCPTVLISNAVGLGVPHHRLVRWDSAFLTIDWHGGTCILAGFRIKLQTEPTCTEAGYTTYTCETCGHSYTGDAVPATGHDYEDGSCIHCGAEDPDWTEPEDPFVNPFIDVKENDYFYDPVLWAVENGITNGTGNGKFSPEDSCTRGQIVTFLYRALAK